MHTFAQKPKARVQATPAKSTVSGRAYFGQSREVNSILHLQRAIGNQAVLRLLEGKPDGLEADSDVAASGRFGHDFSRIPIHAKAPVKIQPKLAINHPGDIYEQEADRISEQMMRVSEPQLQRACACGGECKNCQAKQPNHEIPGLQTKRVQAGDTGQSAAPPIVREVLAGPGQPLDSSTRDFMESRFGYDFSRVRIHNDARAADSARSVNALAYTIGTDVVFGAGQYSSATAQGRRLLAHELAHVVQQGQAATSVGFLQRQVTPAQPAPKVQIFPGARCDSEQRQKVEPAVLKANQWLSLAIPALDAFISGAKTKQAQAAAAALNKHFHSVEPAVVTYIRDRLRTIQSDIFTRQNFRINCPPASDVECSKTSTGTEFAGVVSENQDELNFCERFFKRNEDDRASTIIHEFGHALLGLSKTQRMLIIDRAYKQDPYYHYLTTGEALTNAESYAMFAREMATGSSPAQGFIVDWLVGDCPDAWVPVISDALTKARQWNHKAALNTKHTHQFSRVYKVLDGHLKSGDSNKCIPDGGGRCSKSVVAYWYMAGDLRICPSLIALPTPDERALSLLAALYGYKDLVDGDAKRLAAAGEARRLHTANVPTTAEVLSGA